MGKKKLSMWQLAEEVEKHNCKHDQKRVKEAARAISREPWLLDRPPGAVPDPLDAPDYVLAHEPASEYVPVEREWLWPGRISIGALSLLAGQADAGKSLVAVDLAARVTRGGPWPDGAPPPDEPANVLILSAEGDHLATLLPRLARAGADLARVFISDGLDGRHVKETLLRRRIRLPEDLRRIRETVDEHYPTRLVIIDPLWAFCSGDRKERAIAGSAFLAPLAELAAECETAILGLTGLKRDRGSPDLYAVAEGRALTGAARGAFGIVRHPKSGARLLFPLRMALAARPGNLEFRIADGKVEWREGDATLTVQEVRAAEEAAREGGTETEEWLSAFLANGSQRSAEIFRAGAACGLSPKTLNRAKAALGIRSQRYGFNGDAHWSWSLRECVEQKNAHLNEN